MIAKVWAYGGAWVLGLVACSSAVSGGMATSQAQVRARQATTAAAAGSKSAGGSTMLPARVLDCHLARITNFDPEKEQLPKEYTYEGDHAFRLFLPSIPQRTKEPPRSTQRAEPVDPRTHILSDPDGISVGAIKHAFDRVVDYWPERVEMTTPVSERQVNLIVLQKSEQQPGLTDIFMTKAKDAITFDTKKMYSGHCKATIGAAALALVG